MRRCPLAPFPALRCPVSPVLELRQCRPGGREKLATGNCQSSTSGMAFKQGDTPTWSMKGTQHDGSHSGRLEATAFRF
jgi:hypothetical protein